MSKLASAGRNFRHWLVLFPRAVPVAIFLLTLAITGLSVFSIERTQDEKDQAELRQAAVRIGSALERRAAANSSYLRAGAAMLATSDHISLPLFRRFVAELRLDSDYRGAEGVGWAPRVMRQRVGGRTYAVPVTYLEPSTVRNSRAVGYDMYSEPVRRAAMEQAESSERPAASGRVVLVQEDSVFEPGFLIYMPVFQTGPDGKRLEGFIYSPFNARVFLAAALEMEPTRDVAIRVYDGKRTQDRLLAEVTPAHGGGRSVHEAVSIGGRPWILEVATPSTKALTTLSLIILLFGMLVAGLLMLLARLLTQQVMEDRTALDWLNEQNAIRNSLTRELNHRLKNTLANVLSIIALSRRKAKDIDAFVEGLNGRIRALSATHDLLIESNWGSTPVRALIEAELAPYAYDGGQALTLHGPEVRLAPGDALSLGLAIHELATNAAKYGALGAQGGMVTVEWHRVSDQLVRIDWNESGGPRVSEPRERGFGTDLIEKIVAHELGNPVELRFEPEGVKCSMTVPVREPAEFVLRAARQDRPR